MIIAAAMAWLVVALSLSALVAFAWLTDGVTWTGDD